MWYKHCYYYFKQIVIVIDLVKLVQTSKILEIENFAEVISTNFYIRKYGSQEEADKVFNALKETCKSEEEFLEIRERKMQSDVPLEQFNALMEYIYSFQSFTTVVNREEMEISLMDAVQNDPDSLKLVVEIMEDFSHLINEKFGYNKELIKEKLLREINDKITFTIKETREELGFKNQRTFKKWLNYFYGNKFDNCRKFNLLEYIDVIKKFFLKPEEHTIDLNNNIDEYKKRLADGIVIKKSNLIKLTNNDYKLLKNEIDDLKEFEIIKLPENVDFYPYSVAQLIIKNLE